MSVHSAEVIWSRDEQPFSKGRYSRRHRLRFDGGVEVAGSSSPHVVPLPYSAADAVDPEEAFVASLASCHMLWFLSLAAEAGYVVDHYRDSAAGTMARGPQGKLMITQVVLRPEVAFAADHRPDEAAFAHLHERAHDECFIANSVKSDVRCEPRLR